ncbi:MAG: hypothetical protein ACREKI_08125 [Gemmatimonadota bacterium]
MHDPEPGPGPAEPRETTSRPAGASGAGSAESAADSTRAWLLRGYYLATPLFLLADVAWGWNVRVVGLEGYPGWRIAYYLVCFGLGALAWMKPERADLVGLVESGVNLAILIVGTYVAYWGIVDQVLADQPIVNPFTTERIANLILAGSVLSVSYYGNPLVRRASRRRRGPFG